MRSITIKTITMIIGFVILVGLACGASGDADPTATSVLIEEPEEPEPADPTEPVIMPSATTASEPTNTTAPPTEEVEEEPPAYFTEEFDNSIDSWSYFLMNGEENDMDLYTDDGYLVFDLQGENQWVYVIYDEYSYPEVRIDALAENRGKNTNNVSLICNYTDRFGWYEFNISNGGMYNIYAYSEVDESYFILDSGGSTHVNMGKDKNTYTAICRGNQLELYINGYEEASLIDKQYNLTEGQVGISVSSFNVLPILVEIDFFSISLP